MRGFLEYLGFWVFLAVMLALGGLLARTMDWGEGFDAAQGGAITLWVALLFLGGFVAPRVRQWWRDRRNRLSATATR